MSKYIILNNKIRITTHQPRIRQALINIGASEIARDLLNNKTLKPIIKKAAIEYKQQITPIVVWQLELPAELLDQAKQVILDTGYNLEEAK